MLRVTHLDQSNYSPRILAVFSSSRSNVVRSFVVRLTSAEVEIRRGALVCRKFDRVRILLPRIFHCHARVHVSLGCDIHAPRPGERSAKRQARYDVDVSSLANVTITRSPHATRYPIVCYYSCITRYRRVHVVPFARSIIRAGRRDVRIRHLLARIVLRTMRERRRETQTVH